MSKRRSVIKAPPAAAGRKGWKSWEVILAVVGTLASIAGLVVGVIPLLRPSEPSAKQERPTLETAPKSPPAGGAEPAPKPAPVETVPLPLPPPGPKRPETKTAAGEEARASRKPIAASTPRKPTAEVTRIELADGEQEVLLEGRLSLAVEFGSIGAERYMTLHLNAQGRAPEHHAVFGGGERFAFELDGKKGVVSVLRVDWEARSARLRVDGLPGE